MFLPIKKFLSFHINKLGLKKDEQNKRVFLIWEEVIEKNCQPHFKDKAKPLNLSYGTLIIDCLNAGWACEFQLISSQLIREINNRFKKKAIEKIKFVY